MIVKRALPCILVLLCSGSVALGQETVSPDFTGSYLCKTTAMGGVGRTADGKWEGTGFSYGDQAFVIKVSDIGKRVKLVSSDKTARAYTVEIKIFGSEGAFRPCKGLYHLDSERTVISTDGNMMCIHTYTHYLFNFGKNLFQVMHEGGYLEGNSENDGTPFIAVGKCEKID